MERMSESLEEKIAKAQPSSEFSLKELEESYDKINTGLNRIFPTLRTIYIEGIISIGVSKEDAEEYIDDAFSPIEEHLILMLKDLDGITTNLTQRIDDIKKGK